MWADRAAAMINDVSRQGQFAFFPRR